MKSDIKRLSLAKTPRLAAIDLKPDLQESSKMTPRTVKECRRVAKEEPSLAKKLRTQMIKTPRASKVGSNFAPGFEQTRNKLSFAFGSKIAPSQS
jgi:hypothetical protein